MSVKFTVEHFNIQKEMVWWILADDLKSEGVCAQMFPNIFTGDQKLRRMEMSRKGLRTVQSDEYLIILIMKIGPFSTIKSDHQRAERCAC